MARQTTIKAFAEWIGHEENVLHVLDLVANGQTLQKVCTELKKPYTCLHEYFHRPENLPRYEAARKAWADAKQDEAIEIVESVPNDRDAVAAAKLRTEVYANQAKAYHRERWGEKVEVDTGARGAAVDAALLGTATELLKIARERRKPAIEVKPVPVPALEDRK